MCVTGSLRYIGDLYFYYSFILSASSSFTIYTLSLHDALPISSEICIRRIPELRDFTFKKAMCEAGGSEDKVTQSVCQVTIYPILKILPCEIGVFCFRKCTAKYKSEQIRFKIFQIFVQPDGPSPGGGELAPFQIQKFVCRHIFRQDKVPMLVKHSGKHDAMKDNVIFPDKMDQTGILILPVFFP